MKDLTLEEVQASDVISLVELTYNRDFDHYCMEKQEYDQISAIFSEKMCPKTRTRKKQTSQVQASDNTTSAQTISSEAGEVRIQCTPDINVDSNLRRSSRTRTMILYES